MMMEVDTLQQYRLEDIMEQVKLTISNHTKSLSSWKGYDTLYMVRLQYELFQENQMINSNKYYSKLDHLKAAIGGMHSELTN